jgi:hypothetical protein
MDTQKLEENRTHNLLYFSIGLVPILIFIYIVIKRISFPFDLEWAEGAGINQVARILNGQNLYLKPDLLFSPVVYTPLYYHLSAGLTDVLGATLLSMRLVSLLSSVLTAGLIFWFVNNETRRSIAGWLAAALYLGCYNLSDGFYDLARVDALYVLVLICGLVLITRADSRLSFAAVGLFISLAFYVKQSAIIVFLPFIGWVLLTKLRNSWPLILSLLLGLSIPWSILQISSDGWFSYYIFHLPRQHGFSVLSFVDFWVGDTLSPLAIAVGFSIFYILSKDFDRNRTQNKASGLSQLWQKFRQADSQDKILGLFTLGVFISAWATRSSNGGGPNNLIPVYMALSILFGLGFNQVVKYLSIHSKELSWLPGLLICLVAIQFIGLIYNPFNYLPTDSDLRQNNLLLEEIIQSDHPVFIPYRSHLPGQAGKQSHIHIINMFELIGYFHGEVQTEGIVLVEEIQRNICAQSYGLVVLDQPVPWIESQLEVAYDRVDRDHPANDNRGSKVLAWQQMVKFRPKENYDPISCQVQYDDL